MVEIVWPLPRTLPANLNPVELFRDEMLPTSFLPWIKDIADRMQCPIDYPAVGAMTALASVVGTQLAIRPKQLDDWTVVPNLFGAIIGPPSALKTPALDYALTPLRRLAEQEREVFDSLLVERQVDEVILEARKKDLHSQIKNALKSENSEELALVRGELCDLEAGIEEPAYRRYVSNDPTVEKLGELLRDNPNGLLIFRDELTGWLRNLEKQGRESDRSFYLEAWKGTGGFTYDRIGRGTVHIENACVSILGGIQPGPLMEHVRAAIGGGSGADGLLQRFQLLVWPEKSKPWCYVDRKPDAGALEAACDVFERLANLDPVAIGANVCDSISFLRFSRPAQEVFDAWLEELECKHLPGADNEAFEGHLSKYRSLMPSLALLIHLANGDAGPVNRSAALRAAVWTDYLMSHARRVYQHVLDADFAAARALAKKINAGKVKDAFKPWEVVKKGWKGIDGRSIHAAIEILAEHDWLLIDEVKTGGRPSIICTVNPRCSEVLL